MQRTADRYFAESSCGLGQPGNALAILSPGAGKGREESPSPFVLRSELLGMTLDSHHESTVSELDALDQTVVRCGDRTQPGAEVPNSLVVQAVDFYAGRAHRAGEH